MEKPARYITTPIYYPNAEPHLGHAYTTLLCDVYTRFHALAGDDTYFLTGTDENTQKVIQAAQKADKEPRQYLEEIVERFKLLYGLLGISYTQFIRTSDEAVHWPGVVEVWNRIQAKGDLYKGEYNGLYCVGCESFKTEKDLVDGNCPDHSVPPLQLKEENYFFKLSSYTETIKNLIISGGIPIVPASRKNEILAFLEGGLVDISFSRPAKEVVWGIPVPGDNAQKMYVWMDALTNYITALGFGRGEENMRFWPGVHVVGKDILRFHAVIWPAMLLSAGLPLPKEIYVHGMIISDGKKMSKSLGNVISPYEMVEKYGTDATRYLLLRHVHPFEDTDITWERLDEWYTANLVNGLGNLVARVMKMAETHLTEPVAVTTEPLDPSFFAMIEEYEFQNAMVRIWEHVQKDDAYIQETEPFKKIKSDNEEEVAAAKAVIVKLVQHLHILAQYLVPFMPATAAVIIEAVKENKKPENLFNRLQD